MNSFNGKGRIASDIKCYVGGDNSKGMIVFSLAIPNLARRDENGNVLADFIQCVAYGSTAQTINTYLSKGDELCLSGRLQTNSYEDKTGIQRRSTEVVVEEMFFCGTKKKTESDDVEKTSKGSKKTA